MSSAFGRLSKLLNHFAPSSSSPTVSDLSYPFTECNHHHNFHTLSPTYFLPRAAAIEPEGQAIYHVTANNQILRRTYGDFADRARGFAYYLVKHGYKRVGILAPNTPAFLEALFGIGAAGSVNIAINYRLKPEDISYIFQHSEADAILVDAEFVHLLDGFRKEKPNVHIIIDTDTDATDAQAGDFDRAVIEGLKHDQQMGNEGWDGLKVQAEDEDGTISLAYTSGTTAKPKGVEYTHRGAYLAALANVIESGLNIEANGERAKYLWTLPMFHANGWTFPWSITSVRGIHYCLRKIDYPEIWRLLKTEGITHFNGAPTVNTLLCADKNAEKLSKPVRVTVAASPPTAHLFRTMMGFNLHPVHVYGLTETYGPITKCYFKGSWLEIDDDEKFERMARQGHGFITSQAVRVIKTDLPEGELMDVQKDGKEIGEIVFTGNICARGYYRDPEATRKLWAGGVNHSGDLAVWYPSGEIKILDRAKDIIISGGENISSVALESMLATHPDVLEVAVVAIQDEKWGECPKAFITVKDSKQLSGADVIEWAKHRSTISRYMVPKEVEIVDELPKTSTGKLRKNVLREWAKGGKRDQ
ncbi:putative AMP-binding domain protein [Microthyrium microscopicum]|uniref:Putative AMP-binding domain protein n=1 Tax=Microthyrium microscopicum TaxID=703497 RepID=A0A6A6UBY9_9PEZI|nr:putative AMP-binding domain protein [Microthyrium microscopicum]